MVRDLKLLQEIATNCPGTFGEEREEREYETHPFDEMNIHPSISQCSKKLFDDGHYAQSTFEAFKLIDKEVERISGVADHGKSLMMNAFRETKPKISLTPMSTQSEQNEQEGFKFLFAGSIIGIRNPRGHDVGKVDQLEECLDHLCLASMLLRKLSKRVSP